MKERLKGALTRQENHHEPEELEGSGILLWGSVILQHEPPTTACRLTPAEPLRTPHKADKLPEEKDSVFLIELPKKPQIGWQGLLQCHN